jgi:hypothetical protein
MRVSAGSTYLLPLVLRLSRAMEMLMTRRFAKAEEAPRDMLFYIQAKIEDADGGVKAPQEKREPRYQGRRRAEAKRERAPGPASGAVCESRSETGEEQGVVGLGIMEREPYE